MTIEDESCFFGDDPGKLCDEHDDIYKVVYDNPAQTVIYACKNHLIDILPLEGLEDQ